MKFKNCPIKASTVYQHQINKMSGHNSNIYHSINNKILSEDVDTFPLDVVIIITIFPKVKYLLYF